MFELKSIAAGSKQEVYEQLAEQTGALLAHERDGVANSANFAALLYHSLADVNWVGFYFHREGELVVGPFQGKPACVRIALGRGVCGTAAQTGQPLIIEDVDQFPGHIACDGASRSEMVLPMLKDGRLLGVFDMDSPLPGRFDAEDRAGCERLLSIFLNSTDLNP
jgi:GAF domain-containing protein